jgi:hypothetical protein
MICQILDIVSFFDVGKDLIIIYKLINDHTHKIHYVVEMQQELKPALYYRIVENLNIELLFNSLKYNGCCLELVNDNYVLTGMKFYEINLDEKERKQPLQISGKYSYNPLASLFHLDITEMPMKEYKDVFQNFELRADGGFPVF